MAICLAKTQGILPLKRSRAMKRGRGAISNLCGNHQNYLLITWEIKVFSDEQKLKICYHTQDVFQKK